MSSFFLEIIFNGIENYMSSLSRREIRAGVGCCWLLFHWKTTEKTWLPYAGPGA
jgi:hypothetical protein